MAEIMQPIVEHDPPRASQLPAKKERERIEKEAEEAEKKRLEAEHKIWEDEIAQGAYGQVRRVDTKSLSDSSTWFVEEHIYLGPGGPVAVPCSRGEQKAEYGDLIVRTTIPGPTPEEDIVIIDLVPHEVVPDEEVPPVRNIDYQKYQADLADALLNRKPAKPDNTLPTPPPHRPAKPDQGLPEPSRPSPKVSTR